MNETHAFGYDSAFRLSDTTQGPRGSIHYDYNADNTLADYIVNGGAQADYTYGFRVRSLFAILPFVAG